MRWLLVLYLCTSQGWPRARQVGSPRPSVPCPSASPSPARCLRRAGPFPAGSRVWARTSPHRWTGWACRPGRSRSPWWSTTPTRPGAPTCTGWPSASIQPTPSWLRVRSRRVPGRAATAPARPPTAARARRAAHRTITGSRSTPSNARRGRQRHQPRGRGRGNRGSRDRPRAVSRHVRPLSRRDTYTSALAPMDKPAADVVAGLILGAEELGGQMPSHDGRGRYYTAAVRRSQWPTATVAAPPRVLNGADALATLGVAWFPSPSRGGP